MLQVNKTHKSVVRATKDTLNSDIYILNGNKRAKKMKIIMYEKKAEKNNF